MDVSSPSHRPRPGQVHPLRQVRPRLRGDPGRRRPSTSSAAAARPFVGTAFDQGLNVSSCINCGQCILVCPTGALAEQLVRRTRCSRALADPDKIVVVQHAPAVSVTLAEEFGLKPGTDVDGKMVAALRRVGFDRVFDTSFTADLTIMEEGSELVHRVKTGGVLPMLTSCSPGWIKFVEQFYPEFIPNLSTCKSPQQMMGAHHQDASSPSARGIDPAKIVSVSIMPCTAKKFECARPEMGRDDVPDVDYVLTTRELAELLRMFGVDLHALEPEAADTPFGERSSAGKIFGASGGVMEAAVRTRPLPAHRQGAGRPEDPAAARPEGLQGAARRRSAASRWAPPWSAAWATPGSCSTRSRPAARTSTSSR